MMESAFLQPSWPLHISTPVLDHTGLYSFLMEDFSPSFLSEDSCSSGISFGSCLAAMSAASPDSLLEFPSFSDENIAHILMEESDSDANMSSSSQESDSWTPQMSMSPPELPGPDIAMETDAHQAWLSHLLTAYGEAVENGHPELSEVIVKRIAEKIDPLGEPLERVAFNLFQSRETQGDYLRQQSGKNLETAFEALYQWSPYGRFAHFTADSAILQAIPGGGVDTVHIVDFDLGEGIQWPPLIEAISSRERKVALRITSVKLEEDSQWDFEDTKRRLCHQASSLGLNLRVEQMGLQDLVSEIKRMKKRGGSRVWLAFNLMVGLPHMGRHRDITQVAEFLRVANDLLSCSPAGNRGIITFGDGEAGDYYYSSSRTCPKYSSFFNDRFKHFQALFESMESDFPVHLPEARIAMESLFLSPYVSSDYWFHQWKCTKEGQRLPGLEGWRMSRESLMEAQQIVNQRESSYKVSIQGKDSEMVLEWKGIPLVRVSCWT